LLHWSAVSPVWQDDGDEFCSMPGKLLWPVVGCDLNWQNNQECASSEMEISIPICKKNAAKWHLLFSLQSNFDRRSSCLSREMKKIFQFRDRLKSRRWKHRQDCPIFFDLTEQMLVLFLLLVASKWVMLHRLGSKFFSWLSWQRIQRCMPQQPFCTVICCGKRVPERKPTQL